MENEIIASIREGLASSTEDLDVQVELDGNRALIRVVSPMFAGMSRVRRQQAIYGCIDGFIADGRLHAVTIHAIPPTEA